MKKKLVLKPFVLPSLYILMVIVLMTMSTTLIYKEKEEDDDLTYVSDSIIDDSTPVVNDSQIIILKPFTSENVTVVSGYYDYQAEAANQESSIVKYENTYLQNSGITYSSTEEFDVVSIMDGTITKIYSNDLLGNIIEITHDKDFVSVYQMLDNISENIKVGTKVARGEVIAKGGTSKLSPENYNLHFELMKEVSLVDPNNYLGKDFKEL